MAQISLTSTLSSELSKLDTAAHPHVWLSLEGQVIFGTYPDAQYVYDLGEDRMMEAALGRQQGAAKAEASSKKKTVSLLDRAERITGVYEIETSEAIYRVGSAKQALLVGLEVIEEIVPGTLEKLSKQKARSKRPVSKDRSQLYDLASQTVYSERLKNGFWVATNNKASEAIGYVRKAAKLAGLPSDDFEIRE